MAKNVLVYIFATCVVALTSTPSRSLQPYARAHAFGAGNGGGTKLTKWQQHVQEMFKNSAPADEYFGRMKLSYLGMNNTFRDSAISSGDHTTDAAYCP